MVWLVLILLALLLIGPLRRPYLRRARFTVPATIGAIVAFAVGMCVMTLAGVPPPLSFLIPLAMAAGAALGLGESCKVWCDRTFGERNRPHGRNGNRPTG
jgi:quinol-cytochrome oxidoreductase complex cytochrome b subunit